MESRKDEEATIKVASMNKKSMTPLRGGKGGGGVDGKIKLKKPGPRFIKPGSWKEGGVVEDDKKKTKETTTAAAAASFPSPVVNQLDESSRETFSTGRPLDDVPELQSCKHCKQGVTRIAAKEHIARCLKIKKEKAQRKKEAREARERAKQQEEARKIEGENGVGGDDSDDDDGEGGKVGGGDGGGGTAGKTAKRVAGKKTEVGGKKRKADGEMGGKTKKKKEEPKGKAAKPKGPVDVERQCGVTLANGLPCARSLTCKSHSMSAKRAVPGRSLPYDMLLLAYQKKNQAKQQKAAIDANAPLEDEDDVNAAAVDSDEETAAVMAALAHWNPQPVVPQPVFTPIKRQYQLSRLHEQLQTATNGGRVNIFKVTGFGAQRLPDGHPGLFDAEDAPGEPDIIMGGTDFQRRSSTPPGIASSPPPQLPRNQSASLPPQRRASHPLTETGSNTGTIPGRQQQQQPEPEPQPRSQQAYPTPVLKSESIPNLNPPRARPSLSLKVPKSRPNTPNLPSVPSPPEQEMGVLVSRPGEARPRQQGLSTLVMPSRPSPLEQPEQSEQLELPELPEQPEQPEQEDPLVAQERAIILGRPAQPATSSPAMQWVQVPVASSPQTPNPPPTPRLGSEADSRRGSIATQGSSPVLPMAEPPARPQKIVTLQVPPQRNLFQQQQKQRRSSLSSHLPSSPVVPSQAVPMAPPELSPETVPASPIARPASRARPTHIQLPPQQVPANWAGVPPHLRLPSQVLPSQLNTQFAPRRFSQSHIDPSTSHAAHYRLAQFRAMQQQAGFAHQLEAQAASFAMAGPAHPMPMIRRASDAQPPVSPVSRTMSMPLAMPGLSPSQVEARSRQLVHGDFVGGNTGVEFMMQQTQGFAGYPGHQQHYQQEQLFLPHQQNPFQGQQ
ncbi:SAGA complex subunit Sgf73 [Podospora pseudoanserina]|uniref:SAGA complex subunit Sgf73 n=1 Tax=Podospora pseudoanserina TaxID=2609844 RepID=A0ABR0HK00_9PEZI|nr:SAGA complex subunit Sgf73 [Podospora pseudoanserina]